MALIILLLVLILIAVSQNENRRLTRQLNPVLSCLVGAAVPFIIVAFIFLMMLALNPH